MTPDKDTIEMGENETADEINIEMEPKQYVRQQTSTYSRDNSNPVVAVAVIKCRSVTHSKQKRAW